MNTMSVFTYLQECARGLFDHCSDSELIHICIEADNQYELAKNIYAFRRKEFDSIKDKFALVVRQAKSSLKKLCYKMRMYCMEVGEDNNPILPDPRVRGFGDTAIVFRDFNTFLVRWGRALEARYHDWVDLLDRINYYSPSTNRMLVPLFEKSEEYSYQKELRLTFCRSAKFDDYYRIALEKDPVIVNVDDIRDIAYAVPIDKFLDASGVVGRHYFPEPGDLNVPYDFMVNQTREQMKTFRSYSGRTQVVIS